MEIARTILYVLFLTIVAVGTLFVCSCAQIDFSKKALALESTVFGLDVSVPSFVGDATSFCNLKLGYVTTKYTSAPAGSSVSIDKEYKDASFWKMEGTVTTKLNVDFPRDAPLK